MVLVDSFPSAWVKTSKTPYLIRDITEGERRKRTGLSLPFAGTDIRIAYTHRLYLEPDVLYGWYARQHVYLSGHPSFPDERAGSNDSSADNYLY